MVHDLFRCRKYTRETIAPLSICIFSLGNNLIVDSLIILILYKGFEYTSFWDWESLYFLNTFPSAFIGLLSAKYKIFDKTVHTKNRHLEILSNHCYVLYCKTCPYIISCAPVWHIQRVDCRMLYLFACVVIIHNMHSPRLEKVLLFLGFYSMNMWFLHAMFFTGSRTLQDILYWPQYWIAVWLLGLTLTLIAAIIAEHIQRPILSLYSRLSTTSSTELENRRVG